MSRSEKAGALAGVAGAVALGGVAAAEVARNTRRGSARAPDPYASIDFTRMYAARADTVTTDDGVDLAVRILDLAGLAPGERPELTVLFVHGFSLRLASWHMQWFDLADRWADRRIRMVAFDLRGHGRSDPVSPGAATIARLGDDVAEVLAQTAPAGPVVLAAHSMGGMSVMACARRHPELFDEHGPVIGAVLVATTDRGLTDAGLGQALRNPLVDAMRRTVHRKPGLLQAGRDLTRVALEPLLVAASFGPGFHSPAAGRAVERMIQNTPIETVVDFLGALADHDESAALPTLAQIPSVVVCGDDDKLTGLANSRRMVAELGDSSRLVVVPGAGHMVGVEAPGPVTDAIADLVNEVIAAETWRSELRRRWWQRRNRVARGRPLFRRAVT